MKLEEKELQELKEIQKKLNEVVYTLGNLELQKILNDLQKDELIMEVKKLKVREKEASTNIQIKYGDGNINLETGEFTSL